MNKWTKKQLPAFCAGIFILLLWTIQAQAISTEALQQGIPSLAPMLEKVTPAVVSIRVSKAMPTSGPFLFGGDNIPEEIRRYFENRSEPRLQDRRQPYATGAGSGVIIDAAQGFVITNHHVVAGAQDITVQLSDNRTLQAELIGSDAGTDIALLKIVADDLVELQFADSDSVQVGDYVVAIGNPFGIGQTVTSGIVSALGRSGLNNNAYEDFIQTDAAINLGNSGGALVDMEGRLIGINSAIISGNGGSNGIGFAVPGDMVEAVLQHLESDGEVRRGLLGVTITNVTPDLVAALDVSVDAGALVTSVMEGGAAERVGVQISDVIVAIDGKSVGSSRELRNIVGLMRQDQAVELELYRGGERMTLQAIIGGADGLASVSGERPAISSDFRGARLRSLASTDGSAGVQVVSVQAQSRAFLGGLRDNDVIVEVNRESVADLAEFNALAESSGRVTALTVLREERRLLLFVS